MDPSDIEKLMTIGNMLNTCSSKTETNSHDIAPQFKNKIQRQTAVLNNILPYVAPDIRKQLFALIKIIELKNFESGNITMQEKFVFNRKKFIDAALKYLSPDEKQVFNTFFILSQMGKGEN